ncbi:MAG: hypothetical protein ACPGPF_10645 [Pontibacterium sp.]
MNKGPDLLVVLVVFFLVGTVATGISNMDLGLVTSIDVAGR